MEHKKWFPLRIIVHAAAWLPLIWLVFAALTDNLTINPIQAAMQRSGQFALIFLLLSLSATPVNSLFGFHQALKVRRALGLYAFLYAVLHFFIFIFLDYGLNLTLILEALVEKRFIIAGASALIILTALALTSFQWWMKRLGKKWKYLHRLVYLAGIFVVLHFAWARKGDIFSLQGDILAPLIAGIILMILLILRLPIVRKTNKNIYKRIKDRRLARV